VTFSPKNMTLPVRLNHDKFNLFSALSCHDVIRATLPCGAQYAIDPTGLQLGWKHTTTLWEAYAAERIRRIELIEVVHLEPAGSRTVSAMIQGQDPKFNELAATNPLGALFDTVVHGVNKMILQRGTDIQTICKLKDPSGFASCRAKIVGSFKRGIDQFVHDRELGAWPLLYLPPLNGSDPTAMLRQLNMLWYTRTDLDDANGSREVLKANVRRRWHQILDLGEFNGVEGAQ